MTCIPNLRPTLYIFWLKPPQYYMYVTKAQIKVIQTVFTHNISIIILLVNFLYPTLGYCLYSFFSRWRDTLHQVCIVCAFPHHHVFDAEEQLLVTVTLNLQSVREQVVIDLSLVTGEEVGYTCIHVCPSLCTAFVCLPRMCKLIENISLNLCLE